MLGCAPCARAAVTVGRSAFGHCPIWRPNPHEPRRRTDIHPGRGAVLAVVVAGCLISLIGFGVRGSFGLYLEPMTVSNGWSRQTFAFAMAVQNLLWGIGVRSPGPSLTATEQRL